MRCRCARARGPGVAGPAGARFRGAGGGLDRGELPRAAVEASLGCGNPVALATLSAGEGLLRFFAGDCFEVYSAGTEATSIRPEAVAAMGEIGIDSSRPESKTLGRYVDQPFDCVITVCDDANEACPVFPGAETRLHWSLRDPSQSTGTDEERLEVFRAVRDELMGRIERELVGSNPTPSR